MGFLQQLVTRKFFISAIFLLVLFSLAGVGTYKIESQAKVSSYKTPITKETTVSLLQQHFAGNSVATQTNRLANLSSQITEATHEQDGTFGVAIYDFASGESYIQNGDEPFYMASTYKVPLVITALNRTEAGTLPEDTVVGSTTLTDAENRIITVSDNDLAAALAAIVGWDAVGQTAKQMGMTQTTFDSNFTTTPRDQLTLLKNIYLAQGISQDVRNSLLTMMANQQINDRIPKYLPKTVTIAHKTGELDDVRHDVGVVLGSKDAYSIVLMAKGLSDPEGEKDVMAQISLAVFNDLSL